MEVDFASKEIVESTSFDFSELISRLTTSGSFATTHETIESLKDYIKFLSDDEIQALIKAGTENDQIYHIAGDEDVKEFFLKLYQAKSPMVSEDTREAFQHYFEIK